VKPVTVALALILLTSVALAGPNEGGMLVVHAPSLVWTSDVASYAGMSGVACGQDGPASPAPECPPYDPIGGAIPCDPFAANPTSTMAEGVTQVWYVLAAFWPYTCPRLKALAFRIRYDESKIFVSAGFNGPSDPETALTLPLPSDQNQNQFPADGSGMTLSFTKVRTSLLQELWWFSGYVYVGATDATFALDIVREENNDVFVDDAVPSHADPIAGVGVLGLGGGAVGYNPNSPLPVGTCCLTDGTCDVTIQPECRGTWTWAISHFCDPNPCPQPTGACCNQTTGTCSVMTQAACQLSWMGPDVPCNTVTCQVTAPAGSCCLSNGSCSVTVQAACAAIWTLSGTCVPNICPAPDVEGACCAAQGTCALTMRADCEQPSQWHAEWPACEPNPCPTPVGACCALDESCRLTILVDCDSPAVWRSEFTVCDPNPCLTPSPTERTSWGQLKNRYR
jgi:hypothetical protein